MNKLIDVDKPIDEDSKKVLDMIFGGSPYRIISQDEANMIYPAIVDIDDKYISMESVGNLV